jgi:ketosteroid isomerase-like protein
MFGLPPTAGTAEADGVALVEFRDGKLARLNEYWDAATVMRQLGADIPQARMPTPAT